MLNFALVSIAVIAVALCLMYVDHRARTRFLRKGACARKNNQIVLGGQLVQSQKQSRAPKANYVSPGESQ